MKAKLITLLVASMIVCIPVSASEKGTTYPETAMVVDISTEGSEELITAEICTGINYQFTTAPNTYHCGDFVALTMDDNGTENNLDDIILDHKYVGCMIGWKIIYDHQVK